MNQHYPFTLLPLPYSYQALEPFLDERTLHFHHDKHLQTYVEQLNQILKPYPHLHNKTLTELLSCLNCLPEEIQNGIRNNAGGVYNHQLYFALMSPQEQEPSPFMKDLLCRSFGSLEQWKNIMKNSALTQFGSGYAWLVACGNNQLGVVNTPNQNTPPLNFQTPLLLVDVWEHAYYLEYQNRRVEYLDNWFCHINWNLVEQRLPRCGG